MGLSWCFKSAEELTRILVAVNVVQVTRLLAQDHTVQTLVDETIVVLDNLPHQLGRHDVYHCYSRQKSSTVFKRAMFD